MRESRSRFCRSARCRRLVFRSCRFRHRSWRSDLALRSAARSVRCPDLLHRWANSTMPCSGDRSIQAGLAVSVAVLPGAVGDMLVAMPTNISQAKRRRAAPGVRPRFISTAGRCAEFCGKATDRRRIRRGFLVAWPVYPVRFQFCRRARELGQDGGAACSRLQLDHTERGAGVQATAGFITWKSCGWGCSCLPTTVAGAWLGARTYHALSDGNFAMCVWGSCFVGNSGSGAVWGSDRRGETNEAQN